MQNTTTSWDRRRTRTVRRRVRSSASVRRADRGASAGVGGGERAACSRKTVTKLLTTLHTADRPGQRGPFRRLVHEQRVFNWMASRVTPFSACFISGSPGRLRTPVSAPRSSCMPFATGGRPALSSHNYLGSRVQRRRVPRDRPPIQVARTEVVDDPSRERSERAGRRPDHRMVPGSHGVRPARPRQPIDPVRPRSSDGRTS